jgi:hypothetical protein
MPFLLCRLFLPNKKGYPVLPRVIQGVIKRFIDQVQIAVMGSMGGGLIQCDQIGRILAHLAIVFFGHFYENNGENGMGYSNYGRFFHKLIFSPCFNFISGLTVQAL